jgi:hypothetical protein
VGRDCGGVCGGTYIQMTMSVSDAVFFKDFSDRMGLRKNIFCSKSD